MASSTMSLPEPNSSNPAPEGPLEFPTNEERLLHASRNGDVETVHRLMQLQNEGAIKLNLNCKGTSKANRGWSPLHLAAYFGHAEVVTLLLANSADVDIVNMHGDTALHRAAFTDRMEIVALLIQYGANVSIINGEGKMARDVTFNTDILRMLIAIEQAQKLKLEQRLLVASSEGMLVEVEELLSSQRPPNINCVDITGNTPLHCASYRDQRDTATQLLCRGANAQLQNKNYQTPADLAQSQQMKQLLNLKAAKPYELIAVKREGNLSKSSRFTFGVRRYWAVLDKGVLTYYRKRADAVSGIKQVGFKYLDHAEFKPSSTNPCAFTIHYSSNTQQTWLVDNENCNVTREEWLTALQNHREYSNHYTTTDTVDDFDDISDDLQPLGTIADSLKAAQSRLQVLEQLSQGFHSLAESCLDAEPVDLPSMLKYYENLPKIKEQLTQLTECSQTVCGTLSGCLASMLQQERLRNHELSQALEKSRILEDGLHALATKHHTLERISRYSSSSGIFYDARTSDPNYTDTCNSEELSERDSLLLQAAASSQGYSDRDSDSFYSIMDGSNASPTLTGSLDRLHIAETTHDAEDGTKPTANGVTDIAIRGGCTRTKLPAVMIHRDHFSLWTVLKQCIGKELSKITMPIVFNEPISFLQRCCEYSEHSQLLQKASICDDPVQRIKYVAAFVLALGASNVDRLNKPFNPLLGETYELQRDDLDMKIVLEQVSHHPPVSAFHCTSPHFDFHGSIYPKLKFWGSSLEVIPKGVITVNLKKYNESYTWHNPSSCLHNLIVGKLWLEMYGNLEVCNHDNGYRCFLHFKPAGWFTKELHRVEGYVTDDKGKKLAILFGKWTEYLYSMSPEEYEEAERDDKKRRHSNHYGASSSSDNDLNTIDRRFCNAELLWKNKKRPDNSNHYYNFTLFAMRLNELTESMKSSLPQTDVRFRPDIRYMEKGEIDLASEEKHRIEEKQRTMRKQRSKARETWEPLWFRPGDNAHTEEPDWLFTGKYWDRNYSKCPDIF